MPHVEGADDDLEEICLAGLEPGQVRPERLVIDQRCIDTDVLAAGGA